MCVCNMCDVCVDKDIEIQMNARQLKNSTMKNSDFMYSHVND